MRSGKTMTLMRGTRLGPYEIEALIGVGGMGEVYRARDTRLDRAVAIKVICRRESTSPTELERFQREARAIAQFSHPNICTLYDVGHFEGTDFLVMEHLEGETLDARLSRQKVRSTGGEVRGRTAVRAALPLDETLRIAIQLAEALAAAHRAGIVHRDLKPGNIMLTRGGVKVLDFGLARFQPWTAVSASSRTSTVPDASLTREGTVIGTLPYMAPEQLEGREVDPRTDIFALGAIVYEMATGRPAFAADSRAGLIAAILDHEPQPVDGDEPRTPSSLERVVRKCLAKNPEGRWQSATDLADQLRWIAPGENGSAPPAANARSGRLPWLAAAAVVLSLASAAALPRWQRAGPRQPVPATRSPQFTKITFTGDVRAADLSPDGKTVAYASGADGNVRVFVRDLTSDRSHEVWKGTRLSALRWFPDGSELLLGLPELGIWRLSRFGGPARPVVRGPSAYLAFGPNEAEFVHSMEDMAGYQVTGTDGAVSRTVWLPGFRWLIGLDWNRVTNRVFALSHEDNGAYAVWSTTREGSDARRHYSDMHPLHAVCSSPATGETYVLRERSDATEILKLSRSSSNENEWSSVVLTSVAERVAARSCRVSEDGDRMLYSRKAGFSNLWRLDLRMPGQPALPLTHGTSLLQVPRVSPDGQIVASLGTGPNSRVVRVPAVGGEPLPITAGTTGVPSPDGRRLAFVSGRTAPYRVLTSDANGLGAAEVPGAVTGNATTIAWLPDGRLAWQTADGGNHRIRDLANGQEELLMRTDAGGYASHPQFSPDNRQVAIFWITKKSGLYVLSWPSRDVRFLASDLAPIGWSQDGEWIYALQAVQPFKAPNSTGALVRVSARTSRVEPVGSFPRGYLTRGACSLTPDRQAIICALAEEMSDGWIIDDFDPAMQSEKRGLASRTQHQVFASLNPHQIVDELHRRWQSRSAR
jgi:serine/threonine protein kinase/Tol biopolymer transport system component